MRNHLVTATPLDIVNIMEELFKTNFQSRDLKGSVLAIDIKEESDKYLLYADIPGVKKEDIKVNFNKGILSIEVSERNYNEVKEGESFIKRERSYSQKYRSFNLGDSVDDQKIEASINEGVLTLILPKKESYTVSKQIEVK